MSIDNKKRKTSSHRKESESAKRSLINKVNSKPEKKNIESNRPSKMAKSSLADKVNNSSKNKDTIIYKNSAASAEEKSNKQTKAAPKDTDKTQRLTKPIKRNGKFRNSFFFKLSKIGRVMLVIYVIGVLFLGFQIIKAATNKGKIIYGSRPVPAKVVNNEQVQQVKDSLSKNVTNVDNIMVDYRGYRFVVVIDMKDNATLAQAKQVNQIAYQAIDKIIPVKDYFTNSKDGLTNDLYIYSADVVPGFEKYDVASKFIYETYKNSAMSKAESYNLTAPRDEKSAQEVIKTLQ